MLKIQAQKCPKAGSNFCEDNFRIENNSFAALADGAGGTGVFAAEWSKYILDNLIPNKPILTFEKLNVWLDTIWEKFYLEYKTKTQNQNSNIEYVFINEGSSTTLVVLWLKRNKFHYISYGDSAILQFNLDTKIMLGSISNLNVFNEPPHLLNWQNKAAESGFLSGHFKYKRNRITLLVSDSLAQYLLLSYCITNCGIKNDLQFSFEQILNGSTRLSFLAECLQKVYFKKDFMKNIWQPLLNSLTDSNSFQKYLYNLVENKLINNDDFTLIAIQ